MKKLIHVVRGRPDRGLDFSIDERMPSRTNPQVVNPRHLDMDEHNMVRDGEFFLVNQVDVEFFQRHLAQNNPGREVRVYSLESSAQTTIGPVAMKRVTADGVLPDGDAPQAAVGEVQVDIEADNPAAEVARGWGAPRWDEPARMFGNVGRDQIQEAPLARRGVPVTQIGDQWFDAFGTPVPAPVEART